MSNIIDYVKWRGDLTFRQDKINEVDNLIFAKAGYFPFEIILETKKEMTFTEVYNKAKELKLTSKDFITKKDLVLLKEMASSKRYRNLKVTNFKSKLDLKEEMQFAAITIIMPDNNIFISYRGTDTNIVSWKEDFNMTFKSKVPAQEEALKYLENSKIGIFNKVYLAGHSKGGNLAVYAAMNYHKKNKIKSVISFDGPGFLEEVLTTDKYLEIKDRVKNYIPQTSIVGKFLNYDDGFQTIKSNDNMINQHLMINWEVKGNRFEYLEDVNKDSKKIEEVITNWLKELSLQDREKMINIIYDILTAGQFKTLEDLDKNWVKTITTMFKSYRKVSKEDRKMLDRMFDYLFQSIKKTLFNKNKK